MKKHTSDHTGSSSTRLSTLEFSSSRNFSRGATEHQPTTFLSTYISSPEASLLSTICLIFFLFPSPFVFSNSLFVILQCMHQHPPQAPFSPNNVSKSFQQDFVRD